MNNRNEIKWQPFNAVINSNEVIKELKNKRNKKTMPILSEDEINTINEQLLRAYHTKEEIVITYFYHNKYLNIKGYIALIDTTKHLVNLSNSNKIYLEQIIKITMVN